MFLSGNTLIPDLSGIPPTAIIRKAARLKESMSINVADYSGVFRVYDQDAMDRGTRDVPSVVLGGFRAFATAQHQGPWLFNTSKTAGTTITKHRSYVRLALSGGDERQPKLHLPACSAESCDCPAPRQWSSQQVGVLRPERAPLCGCGGVHVCLKCATMCVYV